MVGGESWLVHGSFVALNPPIYYRNSPQGLVDSRFVGLESSCMRHANLASPLLQGDGITHCLPLDSVTTAPSVPLGK